MSDVPFSSTSHDHLTLDWRLTTLASWAEQLMEVEVAEEPKSLVAVLRLQSLYLICAHICRSGYVQTLISLLNARNTFIMLLIWLRVEGDTFQVCPTLMTLEAFGVEPLACCAQDPAGYWKRALCA